MNNKFAIIGGSGLYEIEGAKVINEFHVETPFGAMSDVIREIEFENIRFYFLARHGQGHLITPSEINYRANIFGLKKMGIDYIISMSAVGSLDEDLEPTDMVLPDQFIDRTLGIRKKSFFDEGMVGHTSMAEPISKSLQIRLYEACMRAEVKTHVGGTYLCMEGPAFSTRAESLMYKNWGAHIIGMTNVPEAYLAKEAGMAYATIAMVTDFDAWKEEHCTLEEIMKVVGANKNSFHKILKELIHIMNDEKIEYVKENQNVVVSDRSKLSQKNLDVLDVILK